MLKHLLARPACQGVRHLETTITPDNKPSWGLFRSLARDLDTQLHSRVHFERDAHFGGQHDDEHLLTLGPFNVVGKIGRASCRERLCTSDAAVDPKEIMMGCE